jgi:hypothetical protein
VTLQAAIDAALPSLRAEAEARMTSRAKVRRNTGATTTGGDGFEVPVWDVIYADVAFRLGGANAGGSGMRTVVVGTTEVQLAVRVGSFPAATNLLRDGDLIDITAGENAGLVLQIIEAGWQDQATARRVPVMAVQRPAEWT